jgi:hypothetical protein
MKKTRGLTYLDKNVKSITAFLDVDRLPFNKLTSKNRFK